MTKNQFKQAGPLAGLRVLELAHVMAGPTCGRILADLGASVTKLERMEGEDSRFMVPPWQGSEAAGFLMLNRNKRGIAVDLKDPRGAQIVRDLVRDSDVLIENFRKGAMERLGLGYDELREINAGLIYCSISGFGRTGPYASKGGYDIVAQAMGGIMSVTGEKEGQPPVKAGVAIADIGAGMFAALGIVAAYAHRQKTGEGQCIDTSLFETAASFMVWPTASYFADGSIAKPMGTAHPLDAPYQAFQASDGWFIVGGANQVNWRRLVEAIGAPDLADDPRFKENEDRVKNLESLVDELSSIFKREPTSFWIERLEAVGVPTGPIYNTEQMLSDPQLHARGLIKSVEHKTLGPVKTLGFPVHFSQTPIEFNRGAPVLGEHTSEVLRELGYTDQFIEELLVDKVVSSPEH